MRYFAKHLIISITLLAAAITYSCEKENKKLPVLTTKEVWNIRQRSAMSGGEIIDSAGTSIIVNGVCWGKSSGITLSNNHTAQGGDTLSWVSTLNGLTPATTYYVRAYATNKDGTGYGNEVTFESGPIQTAEISTIPLSSINSTSAISGGIIDYDGGASITSKGICWNTSSGPTLKDPHSIDGAGAEHFVSQLIGLSDNTVYYVRAYANNSAGTTYGNELSFKTISDSAAIVLFSPIIFKQNLVYGTITDADWNVYKTIQIGSQTWMAENLKTTSFKNGEQIANVADNSIWADYTLDAYRWYKDDIAYKTNYGAIYNWYAVNTGKLCPAGWHVPSSAEFTTLITFLGGENTAGGKLKESGTAHWLIPNTGADNESGFSALPGGYLSTVDFISFRNAGYWWSSTEGNLSSAYYILMKSDNGIVNMISGGKTNGMSVRCVKD